MPHSAWKYFPNKKYRWVKTPLYLIKEMLIGRRNNEKDNIILVTGSRGDGKTTFAGKILFQFEDFSPYTAMVYTQETFFEQLKKKNGYVWADEGVVNASKGNVMTKANKILHEAVTINRDNFNVVFFLIPFVEDFDTKILQYVSMWVHIDSRGLGVLMLPSNKGIFGKRNWDVDNMKKIYDEFVKEDKKQSHVPYWIYPNFRGYIRFAKLSPAQDIIVKDIKAMRKNEQMNKNLGIEGAKLEIKDKVNYGKWASKQLAEKLSKGEIRDMDTFMKACGDLKVEPAEVMGKVDKIIKTNNLGKTAKALIKKYEHDDELIRF